MVLCAGIWMLWMGWFASTCINLSLEFLDNRKSLRGYVSADLMCRYACVHIVKMVAYYQTFISDMQQIHRDRFIFFFILLTSSIVLTCFIDFIHFHLFFICFSPIFKPFNTAFIESSQTPLNYQLVQLEKKSMHIHQSFFIHIRYHHCCLLFPRRGQRVKCLLCVLHVNDSYCTFRRKEYILLL